MGVHYYLCLADTPEDSAHTSIQQRLIAAKTQHQPGQLLPFAGNPSGNIPDGLPFRLGDYFILVELTGRHFHPNKRGKIDDDASPILTRAGLEQTDWNTLVSGIETEFKTIVSLEKLMAQRKKSLRRNAV